MSLALAPCCCTDCERAILFWRRGVVDSLGVLVGDPMPCWAHDYSESDPDDLRGTNWLSGTLGYDHENHRLIGFLWPNHPDFSTTDDRLVALRLGECEITSDGAGMPFDVLLSASAWQTIVAGQRDNTSATYQSHAGFFHADDERLYGYSRYHRRTSTGGTAHFRVWSVDHSGGDLQTHVAHNTVVSPNEGQTIVTQHATVCRGVVRTVRMTVGFPASTRNYSFYRDDGLAWFASDFGIDLDTAPLIHPLFWLETTSWALAYCTFITHLFDYDDGFYGSALFIRAGAGGGHVYYDDGAYSNPLQRFWPLAAGYDETNDHIYVTWRRYVQDEEHSGLWKSEYVITKITAPPTPGNLVGQSVVESYCVTSGSAYSFGVVTDRWRPESFEEWFSPIQPAWSLPIVRGNCSPPLPGCDSTVVPPDPGCECIDDTMMWVRVSGLGFGRFTGEEGSEFRPDFPPLILNEEVDPDCVGIDRYWHVTWSEANGVYRCQKIAANTWEWRGGDCVNMLLVAPRLEYLRVSDSVGVQETSIHLSFVRVTAECTDGQWDDPAHASISFGVVAFSRYKLHTEEEFPPWSCSEAGDLLSARICSTSEHRRLEFCGGLNESRVKWERFDWNYSTAFDCDVEFSWSCPTGDPNGYIAISTRPLSDVADVFPDDDFELPV